MDESVEDSGSSEEQEAVIRYVEETIRALNGENKAF